MGILKRITSWRAKRERDSIKKHFKEMEKIRGKKKSLKARIRKKERITKRSSELKKLRDEVKGLERQVSKRAGLLRKAETRFGTAISKQVGKAKKSIKKEIKAMVDDFKKPPSKRRGRR